MKLLFNVKKKTVFLQTAKDCYISMQSSKREIVPRQNLVKLKPTITRYQYKMQLNKKEVEILNTKLSNFDNFITGMVDTSEALLFKIDEHLFDIVIFKNLSAVINGNIPIYALHSLIKYIINK